MGTDGLGRGDDLLLAGVRAAESDVLAHGAGEEEPFLRDDPQLAPQALLGHLAEVVAVDGDPAVARVVEAGEELGDRGLAGAGVPDEGNGRPRGDAQIDPVQDFRPAAVAEADAFEGDSALDLRERAGLRSVLDLRRLVHHVHDLVERGDRGEERVVELRELLHRVEEVRQVEHEGEQGADLDRAVEIAIAAVAEDDGCRGGREEVDEGEVEPVRHDRDVVGGSVVSVHLAKMAIVRRLAVEGLHDAHAGDVLGERRGHQAEPLAHRAVRP